MQDQQQPQQSDRNVTDLRRELLSGHTDTRNSILQRAEGITLHRAEFSTSTAAANLPGGRRACPAVIKQRKRRQQPISAPDEQRAFAAGVVFLFVDCDEHAQLPRGAPLSGCHSSEPSRLERDWLLHAGEQLPPGCLQLAVRRCRRQKRQHEQRHQFRKHERSAWDRQATKTKP